MVVLISTALVFAGLDDALYPELRFSMRHDKEQLCVEISKQEQYVTITAAYVEVLV